MNFPRVPARCHRPSSRLPRDGSVLLSILLLTFLGSVCLSAGTPAEESPAASILRQADWRFSHLSIEDGLAGRVLALAQDPQGFLWFGMQSGLVRHDGNQARRFTQDPDDPTSLSGNYVRSLHVDRAGRLWIGVQSGDLNLWRPEREDFQPFSSPKGGAVWSIVDFDDGRLLVAGQDDLLIFDIETGTFHELQAGIGASSLISTPAGFWVTDGERLLEARPKSDELVPRIEWPAAVEDAPGAAYFSLTADDEGSLWVSTSEGKIRCYDPRSGAAEEWTLPKAQFQDALVLSSQWDRGRLWIGTTVGLFIFEPSTGSHQLVSFDASGRGLRTQMVFDLLRDQSGQIWLATNDGAQRFDPLRAAFRFFAHHSEGPAGPYGPPSGSLVGFSEDDEGGLWVAALGQGIARLTRSGFEYLRHDPGLPANRSLAHDFVWAVHFDPTSSVEPGRGSGETSGKILWVGHEAGLSRLEWKPGRRASEQGPWHHYRSDAEDPHSLPVHRIVTLFEDASGVLWIGSDAGLSSYDPQQDHFVPGPLSTVGRVLAIGEDRAGRLFAGFDGQGLGILSPADPVTGLRRLERRLVPEPLSSEDLSSEDLSIEGLSIETLDHGVVTAIVVEPESIGEGVWISTLGGGLLRLGADGSRTEVRKRQGIPGDSVKTLEMDERGRLWMSVGGEVVSFDPETEAVRRFRAADGFPRLVHTKSSFHSRSGYLVFGGIDGMTAFLPRDLVLDESPPRAVLTDFSIGEVAMRPQAKDPGSPLATAPTLLTEVTLNHRQNDFSVEMAALHFGDPERNRLAYMLEGVDPDWIEVDAERGFARYTRIPAGRHTLRIRAANRDGIWSEEGRRVEIRILPPPWRSWWAWTLYAAALGLVIVWAVRRKLHQLRDERDRQETELRVLRGLLPICASCKRIRDDEGEWEPLESYLDQHSEAKLSHGICPRCASGILDELQG